MFSRRRPLEPTQIFRVYFVPARSAQPADSDFFSTRPDTAYLIEVGGQRLDLRHSVTKKVGAQSDFLYKNWQLQIQTYAVFLSATVSQIFLPFCVWQIQISPHLDEIPGGQPSRETK